METCNLPDRIARRIRVTEQGCWEYTGSRSKFGYGRIARQNGPELAHRVIWEMANGAPPQGMFVCHACDNPPCCNPEHLFLGSAADNNADRDAKGRQARQHGETNGRARLTAADVRAIRAEYSRGVATQRELGQRYGTTQRRISEIVRRVTWASVP